MGAFGHNDIDEDQVSEGEPPSEVTLDSLEIQMAKLMAGFSQYRKQEEQRRALLGDPSYAIEVAVDGQQAAYGHGLEGSVPRRFAQVVPAQDEEEEGPFAARTDSDAINDDLLDEEVGAPRRLPVYDNTAGYFVTADVDTGSKSKEFDIWHKRQVFMTPYGFQWQGSQKRRRLIWGRGCDWSIEIMEKGYKRLVFKDLKQKNKKGDDNEKVTLWIKIDTIREMKKVVVSYDDKCNVVRHTDTPVVVDRDAMIEQVITWCKKLERGVLY